MLDRTVFAFGSGRSGTTLLAKLIDSSRSVLYRHEPDKNCPRGDIPFLPEPETYEQYLDQSRDYLQGMTRDRAPYVSGKLPVFEKEFRSAFKTRLLRMLVPVCLAAEKAHLRLPVPDFLSDRDYLCLIKSVTSVCRVPLFAKTAPGMKFVHIVRHPGAVVASNLRGIEQGKMQEQDFIDSVSRMSNAKRFAITSEEISRASSAEKSAYTWMVQNDKTHQEMQGNADYMLVSYEDLCVNMRDRMQDICDFLGIPFDAQMQAFIDTIHGTRKDSDYFSVIKNPLANIDKWERHLDAETVANIQRVVERAEIGRFALERYAAAKQQLQ